MLDTLKTMVTGGKKPKVTRAQMLAAIPVRNSAVQWERTTRDEDRPDVALLKIPRRSDRFGNIVAKLFRLPEYRKLELDEIGSDVWEMCDGTSTVDAVTRAVCTQYRLNRRQAEASVTAYLKLLAERRLIAISVKKASSAPTAARSAGATAATATRGETRTRRQRQA